jgi:hypothetical protein
MRTEDQYFNIFPIDWFCDVVQVEPFYSNEFQRGAMYLED